MNPSTHNTSYVDIENNAFSLVVGNLITFSSMKGVQNPNSQDRKADLCKHLQAGVTQFYDIIE